MSETTLSLPVVLAEAIGIVVVAVFAIRHRAPIAAYDPSSVQQYHTWMK